MKRRDTEATLSHKKGLDPAHAEWLVKNRADTQHVSAKLYRLLKEHPDDLETFARQIQMLVAISFSLWRSAFLSDKTGYMDDTNNGAVLLLGEMLQNNAIAYSQERTAKDWTFNYYAGNARYRLYDLKELWPNLRLGTLNPTVGKSSPKIRWELLQSAFERSVDYFEKQLSNG